MAAAVAAALHASPPSCQCWPAWMRMVPGASGKCFPPPLSSAGKNQTPQLNTNFGGKESADSRCSQWLKSMAGPRQKLQRGMGQGECERGCSPKGRGVCRKNEGEIQERHSCLSSREMFSTWPGVRQKLQRGRGTGRMWRGKGNLWSGPLFSPCPWGTGEDFDFPANSSPVPCQLWKHSCYAYYYSIGWEILLVLVPTPPPSSHGVSESWQECDTSDDRSSTTEFQGRGNKRARK